MEVPWGLEVFIDTNIFLYSITGHPRYGPWCEELLDKVRATDIKGKISVIVLNELIHKLVIGEVAQKEGIRPSQAVRYVKKNPEVLEGLKAYEVVAEVESDYNLMIADLTKEHFSLARKLMGEQHLLSNDALHLAVMKEQGITNIATSDPDFDRIAGLKVWKPQEANKPISR